MPTMLDRLKSRLLEANDLNSAAALLRWDQTTYMPPQGAEARGRQIATLSKRAHEVFTDAETGKLLDAVEKELRGAPYDSDEAGLLRATRREFELAIRVPSDFVSEFNQHIAISYQLWTEARPANDFSKVRPSLEKTLELSRTMAGFFPRYDSIADPLIAFSDYGMKAADVRRVFGELRGRLVPIVRAITARPPADDSCLRHRVPEEQQLAFGVEVIRRFGFDFDRGRQDKTHHPFMTKFSTGDVRITTRFRENDMTDSLFSTLHECGHALYELGIDRSYEGSPLANGTSSGIHESQSRLWENVVGRSRGFWSYAYPKLQKAFAPNLDSTSLDTFYRAINKVERSLIRTDSDEVTYNLHVMLRFDLELDMLEGRLAIKDLPEVWRARFQEDIGIRVPDDKDGALQDVHWFSGPVGGAFQGYTLGNILSAQFFANAVKAKPSIPDEIARGEFGTLHGWLRENLYRHGAKYTAAELIERVTGGPMSIEPYLEYLWKKYQPLYGLEESDLGATATR